MRGGAKIGFTVHIGPDVRASTGPRTLSSIDEQARQEVLCGSPPLVLKLRRCAASRHRARTCRRHQSYGRCYPASACSPPRCQLWSFYHHDRTFCRCRPSQAWRAGVLTFSALAVLWAWDHLCEEPRERLDRTLLGFSPSAAVLAVVAEAPVANGLRGMRLASAPRTPCWACGRWWSDRLAGMFLWRGHLAADVILGAARRSDPHGWIRQALSARGADGAPDVVHAEICGSVGHLSIPLD